LRAHSNESAWIIARSLETDPIQSVKRAVQSRKDKLAESLVELETFEIKGRFGVPVLIASPDLQWIVEELIDNAITAMRNSEKKNLSIRMIMEDGWLLIQLHDTGAGIPSSQLEEIFNIGKTSRAGSEHGYGLYRVRRLARSWGGDAYVLSSHEGDGTAFECRFRCPVRHEGVGGVS
jgi:two-component system CitB family sensor kinase